MSFFTHSQNIQHFREGIGEMLAHRPYTLDMPHNPAAYEFIERRFAASGMQHLTGWNDFRFTHEGYTTLVGSKGAREGKTIALVFHYDIALDMAAWHIKDKHIPEVMPTKQWAQWMDPAHVAIAGETVLVGKGVADMLGAAEAMLQAAAMIPKHFPGRVMLIATPDEERGSTHGMIPLLARLSADGLLPDVVIGSESTFMDVLVRRRGGYAIDVALPMRNEKIFPHRYRIVTDGVNMHPGMFTIAKREMHANFLMSRVLKRIGAHQLLSIDGGHVVNVIPNRCEAVIATNDPIAAEISAMPGVTVSPYTQSLPADDQVIVGMDDALEAIAEWVPPTEAESDFGISISPNRIVHNTISLSARVMNGDRDVIEQSLLDALRQHGVESATLSFQYAIKPFFSDPTDEVIHRAVNVLREAGWNPTGNRENYGSSDLNFLYSYPSVTGFELGPIGANEHGADEWVSVASLCALPKIYAEIVQSLVRPS